MNVEIILEEPSAYLVILLGIKLGSKELSSGWLITKHKIPKYQQVSKVNNILNERTPTYLYFTYKKQKLKHS